MTAPWNINNPPQIAYIREDECIGCTKCIPDCPTDAIMGAAKLMHTVITDACTGCELCVPTCPVDCIEIRPVPARSDAAKQQLDQHWQQRFDKHNQRQAKQIPEITEQLTLEERKQYIAEALKRMKQKN